MPQHLLSKQNIASRDKLADFFGNRKYTLYIIVWSEKE